MKNIYITESQLKQVLKLKEEQNSTEIPVDADALGKLNPSKQTEVLNRMKSSPSTDYKIQVDVDDIQSPTELKQITEDTSNESVVIFTKKQIKEAKRSKRIAESKVFTKADIVKNL